MEIRNAAGNERARDHSGFVTPHVGLDIGFRQQWTNKASLVTLAGEYKEELL